MFKDQPKKIVLAFNSDVTSEFLEKAFEASARIKKRDWRIVGLLDYIDFDRSEKVLGSADALLGILSDKPGSGLGSHALVAREVLHMPMLIVHPLAKHFGELALEGPQFYPDENMNVAAYEDLASDLPILVTHHLTNQT